MRTSNTPPEGANDIARRQDSAPLYLINLNTRRLSSNRLACVEAQLRGTAPCFANLRNGDAMGFWLRRSVRQSQKGHPPAGFRNNCPLPGQRKRHGQTAATAPRGASGTVGPNSCGFRVQRSYSRFRRAPSTGSSARLP